MKPASVLGLLALLLVSSPASAACPADSVTRWVYGPPHSFPTVVTTAPTYAEHLHGNYPVPPTDAWEDIRYDLTVPEFELQARGEASSNMAMLFAEAHLALHDTYLLVGPPAASPIPMRVHLHLNARTTGDVVRDLGGRIDVFEGGRVTVAFGRVGSGSPITYANQDNVDEGLDLMLPVTALPGEPIELRLAATAEGTPAPDMSQDSALPNSAWLYGRWSFLDIPPGYTVLSCQGWSSDAPVPARRSTWGGLKTRAR